jgi:hypothetical protein
LEALPVGMMAMGEGMTGRPFYTNYQNNQADQEKSALAMQQWQQEMDLKNREDVRQEKELKLKEAESPFKNLIKTASDVDVLVRLGMIDENEAKSMLGAKAASKGEAAGIEALAKEQVVGLPKVKDTANVISNFFNDLDSSYQELKTNAPGSLETGFGGILSRSLEVPYKKMSGELPQTKALGDRMSKIVYPMAKSYDPGGRLAKDDITAFANVLGTLGGEATNDVAVKAAKELRDLRQVMNKKGADGDAFVNDFLAEAESRGGFYAEIAKAYGKESSKGSGGLSSAEEARYQELLKKQGGKNGTN